MSDNKMQKGQHNANRMEHGANGVQNNVIEYNITEYKMQ